MRTITDQDKKDWAYADTITRTEDKNYVYEKCDNGVVYVLERDNAKPNKPGQVGILTLIGVKDQEHSVIM